MKKNLTVTLSGLLQNIQDQNAKTSILPVCAARGEKHADELCAHFTWENGQQSAFLCPNAAAEGTLFTTLEEVAESRPELLSRLTGLEKEAEAGDTLAEELSAAARETLVLYIPRKMCQKREYLLDVILSESSRAALLKLFILLEADASAVVTLNLHSRGSHEENNYAGVCYCSVGENAHLVLNEVQDFGLHTTSLTRKRAIVAAGGDFHWNNCELGAARSLDDLDVRLCGENASAVIYGLYFPNGDQKMEMRTRQEHLVPHTFSNLYYKGALTDRAFARWEGMIYVDPKAQKTDGYQKNENLMLSEQARVVTQPGLEIITDDVKCSHGTTITALDKEQIFYLTSRGIPEKEAQKLVVRGFFDTILNLITYAPIRGKLQEKIDMKMQEGN